MRKLSGWTFALLAGSTVVTAALAEAPGDLVRPNAPDSSGTGQSLFALLRNSHEDADAGGNAGNLQASIVPRFFFNYEMAYSGSGGNSGYVGAVTSHGARLGRMLLYNEFASLSGAPDGSFMRGNSGVALDWAGTRTRLTLGDVASTARSDLGQGVRLGGISIKRGADVRPDLVTTPVPAFARETGLAGEVDVYVDGVRLYTAPVKPGRSDIRNVARFAGLRQVDVVVRDGTGREVRATRSAYRADRMLSRGTSEFEYSLGAARFDDETTTGRYGDLAFVASHRYGLTDKVTIGAHADGIDTDLSASVGVGVLLDGYGIVSGEVGAASGDADAFAPAGSLRYSHTFRGLRMTAGYKRASTAYAPAHEAAQELGLPAALIEDVGAKFSYSLDALGTITFASTRSSYEGVSPHTLTTLAYSYVRPRRWGIDCLVAYSTGAQTPWTTAQGWTAFLNVTLHLEDPSSAGAGAGSNFALPVNSAMSLHRTAINRSGHGWNAGAVSEAALRDAVRPAGTWDVPVGTVYGNVNPGDAMSDAPPTWHVGWSGSVISNNGVWASRRADQYAP